MFNRVFLIILDNFGIGSYTDEDKEANTLLHLIEQSSLNYNSLKQLGLYNLLNKENIKTIGYYTTSLFKTPNKDLLSRDRELMGIDTNKPYNDFKKGLNKELIDKINEELNIITIGHNLSNDIDIINQYADEQIKTKSIILYPTYNSIIKVSAHVDTINEEELYNICTKIKEITDSKDEWRVSRVIASIYKGDKLHYEIFKEKEFTSKLPYRSVLNYLKENSYQTISIGKIGDLYYNSGITTNYKILNNLEALNKLSEAIKTDFSGLCIANLSDFNNYIKNRDIFGYTKSLKEFDDYLPLLVNSTKTDDLLIITGSNSCDITLNKDDYTKEKVPVFIYSKRFVDPKKLDELSSIADIGSTIANIFEVNNSELGNSFLSKLK